MPNGEDRPKVKRYRDLRARSALRGVTGEEPIPPPTSPHALPAPMPTTPVEQWETYITVLEADAEKQADFLETTWPQITFPRFAVQALIPQLDVFGAQGWEPVSIQPVMVGSNGDIIMPTDYGYSHQYLCVFKRRRA